MPEKADPVSTLREALAFIADWAHECSPSNGPEDSRPDPALYGFDAIEERARAALSGETPDREPTSVLHEDGSEHERWQPCPLPPGHRHRCRLVEEAPDRDGETGDRRLIDTNPPLGGLAETIEFEIGLHNLGWPTDECDCGDQIKGETFNHHVAGMVDYRLTATDGDA